MALELFTKSSSLLHFFNWLFVLFFYFRWLLNFLFLFLGFFLILWSFIRRNFFLLLLRFKDWLGDLFFLVVDWVSLIFCLPKVASITGIIPSFGFSWRLLLFFRGLLLICGLLQCWWVVILKFLVCVGKIAFMLKWTSLCIFNIFTEFRFSLLYQGLYFYFIIFYAFDPFLWNFSFISLFLD